jgi:hypothetical protein
MLTSILIGGIWTFYVTSVLLWSDLAAIGPFMSTKKKVIRTIFEGTEFQQHERPVNLVDHIRRVFGVYKVEGDQWIVIDRALPVWTCPKCLSFWVVSPITAWFFMQNYSILDSAVFHVAAAGISYVIFLWLE